ncbi:cathepsin W-like [Rana temporaria]|uniref:cathepsin W-like n=1 Tax=Rana temporaria TaxID=8407 RepID=UPI001AACAF10|nr:cathepsin W-like [Rana temporaria]
MALLCYLSFVVVLSLHIVSGSYQAQFENFLLKFSKNYQSKEEFQHRLSIFSKNLEVAKRLQKEELGTAKYGVTKFSDLTDEEFARFNLNLVDALPPDNLTEYKIEAPPKQTSCDWRKAGVISEAKHQGKCGSCWAFASVGNIEALWGIRGYPMNLSVQQIIDCGPCDAGCTGGYAWDAFTVVLHEEGLVTEKDYPYWGPRQHCKSHFEKVGRIDYFVKLPADEQAMASFVGKYGTLTVCLNASVLQHYQNGIIHPANCRPSIDHMVLLVGYAKCTGNNNPYWIAKNSWGKNWGENGFFRIYRGKNVCGIAKYPVSAVITDPNRRKIPCPP